MRHRSYATGRIDGAVGATEGGGVVTGPTPRVLVGMLHVGEPSVARVRALITGQADVDVELLEIAHLPEREAHAQLYAAFDAADERFDAVVKVDADMELIEPRLLHAIAVLFRRHPALDHILLGVDDWFSGQRILGMTSWRQGIRWTSPPPELFTDLPTNTARTELKLLDPGRPLVLHAADPTDEQAARYGLHRGLKAMSTGKASRIARLGDVVEHAVHAPQRGRLIALAAIALALEDGAAGQRLLGELHADAPGLRELVTRADDPQLVARTRGLLAELGGTDPASASGRPAVPGAPAGQVLRRGVRSLTIRVRSLAMRVWSARPSRTASGGGAQGSVGDLPDQLALRAELLDLLAR